MTATTMKMDDSSRGDPTWVLVHGAWADGSSWKEVILRLLREGLQVIAAPIPLTSLSDDTAAVQRAIAKTQGPVILAGHAYAGAVIATINDERLKALVYIAALAPDADGFIWMPDDGFRNAFAQNATADQIALSAAVQKPIALKCIQEPVPKPAWRSKPSWFLIAEEDRMINPKTQNFMAKRMGATTRSLAVDHTPLLSAPEKVVDIIIEAKQAVSFEANVMTNRSA